MLDEEINSLLTPPNSADGTPEEEETQIHVSTMFYPGAPLRGNESTPADLVLVSTDSVFFYVHSRTLLASSSNRFDHLVPQSLITPPLTTPKSAADIDSSTSSGSSDTADAKVITLLENSELLNVLLHTIYNLDCAHYAPSYEILCFLPKVLRKYGYDPKAFIQHKTHLYTLILSHAPSRPLDVYAFAACHNLEDLAVTTSGHLLSLSLPSLTDKMCMDIGPIYLKRLFFLHLGRVDALKRLLLPPPHPHPPTHSCDFTDQKSLTRAWALASSYLLCDARPDTSVGMLEGALSPLGDHLWCEQCREMLKERVHTLSVQWSVVKTTI